MCGITGFDFPDKTLVKKMMKFLVHRGPDQNDSFVDDKVSLGHQRLSIIDLSTKGRQPMSNSKETVWVVFNGEIYNYKEIRAKLQKLGYRFNSNTDTEVIVNAYDKYGPECVHLFNGDFAFCIYDVKKKQLFLARDRLGIKPLFYFFNGRQFMFASEYKAFLAYEFEKKIDKTALSRYLTLRYNYGRETLLENIFRVLPGEYLIYNLKTKKITHKRFWQTNFSPAKITNNSEQYFVKNIRKILQDSVIKRLMSDVPLGVYLSGGIDSGSIVSLMHHSGIRDINTFSVGFGYGEETDELKYAAKISERFGTNHQEFTVGPDLVKNLPKIVWHCDEPLADPALLPVYLLSKHTKPKATVVLTGDGGDEVFAGYEQNKFLTKLGTLPSPVRAMGVGAVKLLPSSILNKFFKYADKIGSEGQRRATEFLAKKHPVEQYLAIVSIFNKQERDALSPGLLSIRDELAQWQKQNSRLHNILKMEYETQLPENMLHKGDRMTMAHSIEARVPFLDHRLVEFSETIPASLKLKGFTEKYILRKAMKPFLPKQIYQRKKQRFYVPIDHWLAKDLKPMVDELLSQNALRESEIFNQSAVQRIKERYNRAPLFYARQLWVLLTFQLWHNQFFKESARRRGHAKA